MFKFNLLISFFISMALLSNTVLAHDHKKQPENVNVIEPTEVSTFARFVPERKDDFAWENDLIAFRAYGPALRENAENSGVDCWLKRVDYPVINLWYKRHVEGISYHVDNGEGLDNYHVGSSAGCGSTALWIEGKRVPLETYTSWKILEQTKQRTVFILTYENTIQSKHYKEEKKITIELGKRLYHAESTFWVNGKIAQDIAIAVGLSTHDEKAMVSVEKNSGWLAAWEDIAEYGLGTAVIVAPKRITSFEVVNSNQIKDMGHALYIMNTDKNGQIEYFSGYGWEKAGVISTAQLWQQYLSGFSAAMGL